MVIDGVTSQYGTIGQTADCPLCAASGGLAPFQLGEARAALAGNGVRNVRSPFRPEHVAQPGQGEGHRHCRKSVRGSDPDAALYWLVKALAGEDPEFVMRRLLILAGEDIGLADPRAVQVVAACAQALQYVGLPEGKYHLALATVYVATAPKSNSMTQYFAVESLIQEQGAGAVPMHLRDASYKGAARLGHGQGYRYSHSFPGHHVAQQYLPDRVADRRFYDPSNQSYEAQVANRLKRWREGG